LKGICVLLQKFAAIMCLFFIGFGSPWKSESCYLNWQKTFAKSWRPELWLIKFCKMFGSSLPQIELLSFWFRWALLSFVLYLSSF